MYPRLSDLFRDLFGVTLPIPIYSFGFMVAVGLLAAAALSRREMDRLYAAGRLPAIPVKTRDKNGRERTERTSPSALLWTMVLIAAAAGIAGSKLFHVIDYWDRFVADPGALLFSASGLTFWGGLIFGTIAVAWYVRRHGLHVPTVADALAPGLILGYGIGRIGCYLAGDGDWGLCANPADKPAGLPMWLWSETFPRNILGRDLVAECGGFGVYPTMLYEFAACVLLAGVLWAARKHPFRAGWLFSLYLVFAAVERFLIEFIRVNPDRAGSLSQAQVIAIGLFALGALGLALLSRRRTDDPPARPTAAVGAPAPTAPTA